jgi:hypothetical protein
VVHLIFLGLWLILIVQVRGYKLVLLFFSFHQNYVGAIKIIVPQESDLLC